MTEYRRHALRCGACGTVTCADWPAVSRVGDWFTAQAIVGYLMGRLGASHRDVVEAMAVLYGLAVEHGQCLFDPAAVSEALGTPVEEARHFVAAEAQHVDETGWRECGRLKWLWVNATKDVTTFEVLGGRGASEARRVISPESGASSRPTATYPITGWRPAGGRSAGHILRRDFQALVDRGGESQETGQSLSNRSSGSLSCGTRRATATSRASACRLR